MSSLIAGSRIVTADVLALTTNVETHAASSATPLARRSTAESELAVIVLRGSAACALLDCKQ